MPRALRVLVLEALQASAVMLVLEARALPGSAALLVLEDLGLPLVRLAPLPQALLDLEATLV
jgi:hypothetical protein